MRPDAARQTLDELASLVAQNLLDCEALFANVSHFAADGYGTGKGDGAGRRTEHADPTPHAALSRDELLRDLRDYQSHLLAAVRALRMADSLRHRHVRLVAEKPVRASSLVECANPACDRTMTGIGTDRPRLGRCFRCYRFKLRNDRDWTARAEPDVTFVTSGEEAM